MMRIKGFTEFINEAESASAESSAGARFQFPKGKYKTQDIVPTDLAKLRGNIATDILSKLKEGYGWSEGTEIELVASTSSINVTQGLRKQLEKEGFPEKEGDKTGNYALCQARLKTIRDIMFQMLQIDPNNKEQMAQFQSICTIKETPMPDQSPSEESQYIESTVRYKGQKIKDQISCDKPLRLKGSRADESKKFVGYSNDSVALVASPNTKIAFKFAPGNIPDCLFWYQNSKSYGLTPFLGNKLSREKSGDGVYKGKVNAVKSYEKEGSFEIRLNNKRDAIVKSIITEISKMVGSAEAKRLVDENILGKDGKILVREETPENAALYNIEVIKSPYTKGVKIRVFSPLSDTEFEISTLCSVPKIDTATGKISGYVPYKPVQA
jgi:hypothetical protein